MTKVIIQDYLDKFLELKKLTERAFVQLNDIEFSRIVSNESLSVSGIVQHMAGNMISRWTGFPEADGEKIDRYRDEEFEEGKYSRVEILNRWEQGWKELFSNIGKLNDHNLAELTKIRSEEMHIHVAILRQMSHLSYHSGQIVYVSKFIKGEEWKSLSIPKGQSDEFNKAMKAKFDKP